MDWKDVLKLIRAELAKLSLSEGKIADLKFGAVEGDDDKPGQSFDDLLGVLETGLTDAGTSADGTAASVVKLTKERDALKATNTELKAKVDSAGDVDARVSTAETKATTATERAVKAEGELRSSRILGAARDKLDDLGLPAAQRKTAIALLNMGLDGVEVDDSGKVSGLEARLSKLKTEHPHVFAKPAGGGAQGDGGGDEGGTTATGAGAAGAQGATGTTDTDDDRYTEQLEAALGVKAPAADGNAAAA